MRSQAHCLVAVMGALLSLCVPSTRAADAVSESVMTAALKGRSISALVSHWREHDAFARAVLLLPGSPGIMKIQAADAFGMTGNFLIRSRHAWLDRETLVLSVDAPSDEWSNFSGQFRATERYAQDIQGLITSNFDDFKFPTLWVHHADDPCRVTPYSQAQQHAGKTRSPLITVRSGNAGRGEACKAFTQHGFVGMEAETVRAMKAWVVQGVVSDVQGP